MTASISDIKTFSQKTKLQAEKLLSDTKTVEILNNYGKVKIGGSYALDLMYGADIDIFVESSNPREDSIKALNDLIDERKYRKYQYGDFVKYSMEGRPNSYIIVLICDYEGRQWEVEIWFFEPGKNDQKKIIEDTKNKLTLEKRGLILAIKAQREESGISKKKLSSYKIYKAVLDDRARDIKDILF